MKKIVCELCESMEFTKADGVFVCQGCGTKYTPEEARGLMREVGDAAPAPAAVSAPQSSANRQQLNNTLMLATNAYEAGNQKEAEAYCNKAIELDAACAAAWLLKGKAIGWSSTVGKLRIKEAAHSFAKAVRFSPADQQAAVLKEVIGELTSLGIALVKIRKDRYLKSVRTENVDDLDDCSEGFDETQEVMTDALNIVLDENPSADAKATFLKAIAQVVLNTANEALEIVENRYRKSGKDFHAKANYTMFLLSVKELYYKATEINEDDDHFKFPVYKKIRKIINNSTYEDMLYKLDARDTLLRDTVMKALCDQEIKRLEAEEEAARQAKITAYWEAHAEEKAALEAERSGLEDQIADLGAEVAQLDKIIHAAEKEKKTAVPAEIERNKIQLQIKDLQTRRAGLGIFSGKEKKRIDGEIAVLEADAKALGNQVGDQRKARDSQADKQAAPARAKKKELRDRMCEINDRIAAIDRTLTQVPGED